MSVADHIDGDDGLKLAKADKRILLFINGHENQDLSFSFIAKGLELSDRTVKLCKKKLLAMGLLVCRKGEKLASDLNSPNRYELTVKGRAWVVKNFTTQASENLHTSSSSSGASPQTPAKTENFLPRWQAMTTGRFSENPLLGGGTAASVRGISGGRVFLGVPQKAIGFHTIVVGSDEVKNNRGKVRRGEKKARRPPDPRFEQILGHFNLRKTWQDEAEPAHKRALQSLLWYQPNLAAEEFIRRLDNAFESENVYPFYGNAFTLKDFCANHLRFKDGPLRGRTGYRSN
jgi:hypothetical protein